MEDQMCYIIGKDFNQGESDQLSRIIVSKMYVLDANLKNSITQHVNIQLDFHMQNKHILSDIESLAKKYSGRYSVVLHLVSDKGKTQKILTNKIKFSIENHVLESLRKIIGFKKVWLSI